MKIAQSVAVATGRGDRRHMAPGASRGEPERGVVISGEIKYTKFCELCRGSNGHRIEGQIMCIEQCTFYVISSVSKCHQNRWQLGLHLRPHWMSLQRSPNPIAGFKEPTS